MIGVLIAVGVLAVVGAAVWFAAHSKHPEQTAGHDDLAGEVAGDSRSDRFHGGDRTAGADADEAVGGTNRFPDEL